VYELIVKISINRKSRSTVLHPLRIFVEQGQMLPTIATRLFLDCWGDVGGSVWRINGLEMYQDRTCVRNYNFNTKRHVWETLQSNCAQNMEFLLIELSC